MIKKSDSKAKEELIAKRHEDRRHMVYGAMRSHGKLWGMDCFSWFNPEVDALNAAIQHFHSPVICLINTSLLNELLSVHTSWMKNIDVICTIDDHLDQLNLEKLENGATIFVNSTLLEALRTVQQINQHNRIVLITTSHPQSLDDQLEVDRFIAAAKAL
jgi:hypothetical protein